MIEFVKDIVRCWVKSKHCEDESHYNHSFLPTGKMRDPKASPFLAIASFWLLCPGWGSSCEIYFDFDTFVELRVQLHLLRRIHKLWWERSLRNPIWVIFPNQFEFSASMRYNLPESFTKVLIERKEILLECLLFLKIKFCQQKWDTLFCPF